VAHQPHHRGGSEGQGAPLGATETIAAPATPAGRGGIAIVRVSGARAREIARQVLGRLPVPREATLSTFRDAAGVMIDRGVALFFPAPNSYTGEDVLELHGHGGPVVVHELLRRCVEAGARLARPGEFTERAFLNGRLDLAQAESVADLIDASTVEAARSAARSLEGEFSRRVVSVANGLLEIRMHVEACIDFPEEEIDPDDTSAIARKTGAVMRELDALIAAAAQGSVLREGLTVVLFGRPNVGKSSLLNRLAGEELAIVTPIPGTTRDYVRATIALRGVPIHVVDTAGMREASDEIERIGVERSRAVLKSADAALLVQDAAHPDHPDDDLLGELRAGMPVLRVLNKIDLVGVAAGRDAGVPEAVRLSARTGEGVGDLRDWLLQAAGWRPQGEGVFMARRRHLQALEAGRLHLAAATDPGASLEVMAEELRLAHRALGAITGEVSADDLLGEIFSRFCIGK
jgi:tRNA modification GTPase